MDHFSLSNKLAEELETVRGLCRGTSFHRGDDVLLIAAEWWRNWEQYAGADSILSITGGQPINHPGPINNSPLVDDEISGEFKPALMDPRDYIVVPEDAWNLLVLHYGISSKWPVAIRRKVIPSSFYSSLNKVEIYPLKLHIRRHIDLSTKYTLSCSRVTTMFSITAKIKNMLEIPESIDTRFWYRSSSSMPVELVTLFENGEDTLQKLEVDDDSLFIVETRYHWEDWRFDKPEFEETVKSHGISIKLPPTVNNIDGNAVFQQPGIPGLCGLHNLGNTCFMNSAIQCLSNVSDLTQFFRSGDYKAHINLDNKHGTKGQLAEQYAALIDAMWSGKYSSVSPRCFKATIGNFAPRFLGYSQQDASELMSFILESLHEDLNQVSIKPYYEIEEKENLTDLERGQEFWDYHKKRNASKIVDLFHGQLKSALRCNVCEKTFLTFDPFCYLSAPLPKPTTRKFVAHFRFADPTRAVANLQITVPLKFTTNDIKKALAAQTQVPTERIKICVVSKSGMLSLVTNFFSDKTTPFIHPSYDDVMGFEQPVDSADDDDNVPVVLYVKTYEFYDVYPFLLAIKKSQLTSCELHRKSLEIMGLFRKDTSDEQRLPLSGYQMHFVNISGMYTHDEILPDEKNDSEDVVSKVIGQSIYIQVKWDANSQLDFDKMATLDNSHDDIENDDEEVQLADCLRLFLKEEQLSEQDSWHCPRCEKHQRAFKKLDIWRLPQCLVIHLKRFDQNEDGKFEKLDTYIHYPFELDLSEFLPPFVSSHSKYNLIAVSNHIGSIAHGHYTAYSMNETNGNWYLFDDSFVQNVAIKDDVISSAGYLLIYRRREEITNDCETEDEMERQTETDVFSDF